MKLLQTIGIKILFILIFIYFGFLYTSCSTKPDFADRNYPGIIASEGNVLLYFNIEKDSLLPNQFLSGYSNDDLSGVIDRTDRLSVSIDGFGANSRFDIIAEGNFPKFLTNFAISREESWVKHKGVYTYWKNENDGLYASIPSGSVAVISNSDITANLEYLKSGLRNYIPDIIKMEFEQSVVTVYSHLPGEKIYESLNIPSGKMLIQELYFVVRKDTTGYTISGVLNFLNEKDSKIFSTALKLGLLMKLRETGKSSIMKIVNDGQIDAVENRIIIDNIFLNVDEMIEFISGSGAEIQEN